MEILAYYKNWQGKTSRRRFSPNFYYYGSNKYHPDTQWILNAYDLDKRKVREFALRDMEIRSITQVTQDQQDFAYKIELLSKTLRPFYEAFNKHAKLHQCVITNISRYTELFPLLITFQKLDKGEEESYYAMCIQSEYEYRLSLLNNHSTGMGQHLESIEPLEMFEHDDIDFVFWVERFHKEPVVLPSEEDLIKSVAKKAEDIIVLAAKMDETFGGNYPQEHLKTAIMGGLMDAYRKKI